MYNVQEAKPHFKKAEEWLSKEYQGIHTGRATPGILDTILVDAYGALQPVKNVASISVEDPKTLRVQPWDATHIKAIEKAVTQANIGLSVATDDAGLRVIFPMLTEENRVKLTKVLKERLEDARISVRKIREDELSKVKDADLPEDASRKAKDDLQKIVDETNKALEDIYKRKETEVLTQ